MCFFLYDTMFDLKERRKFLVEHVRETVETFGPHLFPEFDRLKLVKGLKKGP